MADIGRPFDDDLPAPTGDEPEDGPWLTALLRFVRRRADLSQRELAKRAGIPKSTLAAAEAGTGTLTAGRLRRLMAAAGFTLAVVAADGDVTTRPRDPHPVKRDAAGRRYPAHLDVHFNFPGLWWGDHRGFLKKPARRPVVLVELDRRRRDHRWRRGVQLHPKAVEHWLHRWIREGRPPRPG